MEATLDRIETELAEIRAHESRLTARKLTLLAAADAMQAPFIDGARTMAEWTARTLDCETETARRLVRTARGIPEGVFDRLANGEITADRAHVYTEAALAGVAVDLLDGFELAGIRHLCRRRRDEPASTGGYLVVQPQLDEAGYKVHGRLDAVQGSVVTQALEAEADRLCDGIPGPDRPTRSELRADALTSLCEGGTRQAVVSVHHNTEGSIEVDGVAASQGDLEHATCIGSIEEDVGGRPVGGTRQSVSPRQRRRILHRDQHRCTPGASAGFENGCAVLGSQCSEERRSRSSTDRRSATITWSSIGGASPSTAPPDRADAACSHPATNEPRPADRAAKPAGCRPHA